MGRDARAASERKKEKRNRARAHLAKGALAERLADFVLANALDHSFGQRRGECTSLVRRRLDDSTPLRQRLRGAADSSDACRVPRAAAATAAAGGLLARVSCSWRPEPYSRVYMSDPHLF